MHANVVSRLNGVGLTRDVELLSRWLVSKGHTTRFCDWARATPPADVNFYLELFHPRHLRSAAKHVGIFNLEWFEPTWLPQLGRFTQIWAKGAAAFEWFTEQHLEPIYTGFLSRDCYRADVVRQRRVLHVRGKSHLKGTAAVIAAYRELAPLPALTIVSADPLDVPRGVELHVGRLPDDDLLALMNTHSVHLCPSEAEGWGHYIAEAASCGAQIVTTNASPMNEHVDPAHAELITPRVSGDGPAARARVTPEQIAAALHSVLAIPHDPHRVRARWVQRQARFDELAAAALARL